MLRRHLRRVADPLQRAQIWSAAFTRLHTRQLTAAEFFATVQTQLPHESEPSIVRAVITWTLGRGLQVCGSPEEVQAGFAAVAAACRARLSRSREAADATTVAFVDGAVRAGGDPAALHRWHEQGHIEEVPLSVEQRWVLIWRLVELGAATTDFITSCVSPNDSAQVKDWAQRARAAAPNANAKTASWAEVEDERVSNRRLSAVLDGLWSPGRGVVA